MWFPVCRCPNVVAMTSEKWGSPSINKCWERSIYHLSALGPHLELEFSVSAYFIAVWYRMGLTVTNPDSYPMASDGTLNALREWIARIFQASLDGEQIPLKSTGLPLFSTMRVVQERRPPTCFEWLIHCSWRPLSSKTLNIFGATITATCHISFLILSSLPSSRTKMMTN